MDKCPVFSYCTLIQIYYYYSFWELQYTVLYLVRQVSNTGENSRRFAKTYSLDTWRQGASMWFVWIKAYSVIGHDKTHIIDTWANKAALDTDIKCLTQVRSLSVLNIVERRLPRKVCFSSTWELTRVKSYQGLFINDNTCCRRGGGLVSVPSQLFGSSFALFISYPRYLNALLGPE